MPPSFSGSRSLAESPLSVQEHKSCCWQPCTLGQLHTHYCWLHHLISRSADPGSILGVKSSKTKDFVCLALAMRRERRKVKLCYGQPGRAAEEEVTSVSFCKNSTSYAWRIITAWLNGKFSKKERGILSCMKFAISPKTLPCLFVLARLCLVIISMYDSSHQQSNSLSKHGWQNIKEPEVDSHFWCFKYPA